MSHPLTVLIPCKDEQHNILDCIESVRSVADEILVADSGSTDGTLELIRGLPDVRVIEREFVGYADFKNWAIPQAANEWVLIVDADERVTPELAMEIGRLLVDSPASDAYSVRRENYLLGYRLRYSGTQSARCTRLLRRELRYRDCRVHEDIDVPSSRCGQLTSKLEHHTCQSLDQFFQTQNRYASLAARDAYDRGKRARWWSVAVRPPLKFFQFFFLRGGLFDGTPGLLWCGIVCYYNFMKYAKLWELSRSRTQRAEQDQSPPTLKIA